MSQTEMERKNSMNEIKTGYQELQANCKRPAVSIIGLPVETREKGDEIFQVITAKNTPKSITYNREFRKQ